MKNINDLGIYEGQGMSIIDPDIHYTCSEDSRRAIKAMIKNWYGVEPTDEVVDTFIEHEEDWHIVEHLAPDHELMVFHGIRWIDEDRCQGPSDRLNKLLDDALHEAGRDKSFGYYNLG
jgi:hypothetical protein